MKVFVDTCVWSLALRRKNQTDSHYILELQELIQGIRVQMIGAIRREILSGIKIETPFQLLKLTLSAFSDLTLTEAGFRFDSAQRTARLSSERLILTELGVPLCLLPLAARCAAANNTEKSAIPSYKSKARRRDMAVQIGMAEASACVLPAMRLSQPPTL